MNIWFLASENQPSPGGLLCLATFGLPKGAVCRSIEHVDPCREDIDVSRDKLTQYLTGCRKKKGVSCLSHSCVLGKMLVQWPNGRVFVCELLSLVLGEKKSDSLRPQAQVQRHPSNVQNPQWHIIISKKLGRIIAHILPRVIIRQTHPKHTHERHENSPRPHPALRILLCLLLALALWQLQQETFIETFAKLNSARFCGIIGFIWFTMQKVSEFWFWKRL